MGLSHEDVQEIVQLLDDLKASELQVPMAHRGRAPAVAVSTGLGAADSFDHLPRRGART